MRFHHRGDSIIVEIPDSIIVRNHHCETPRLWEIHDRGDSIMDISSARFCRRDFILKTHRGDSMVSTRWVCGDSLRCGDSIIVEILLLLGFHDCEIPFL